MAMANPTSSNISVNIIEWGIIDVQNDTTTTTTTTTAAIVPDGHGHGHGRGRGRGRRTKADVISIEESARLLIHTLHQRAYLADSPTDAIIIEQQPAGGHNTHSNVRMKVMSHVIQSYFYTRNILNYKEDVTVAATQPQPRVTFVSPASKLVDMKHDLIEQENKENGGKKYARNKKYAIRKTEELLSSCVQNSEVANTIFKYGKRDDLADAFLLGYYYLLKQLKPPVKKKRGIKRRSPNDDETKID